MTANPSPNVVERVRRLLAPATSPNPHEAANARAIADRLIEAHGITPEDLVVPEDHFAEEGFDASGEASSVIGGVFAHMQDLFRDMFRGGFGGSPEEREARQARWRAEDEAREARWRAEAEAHTQRAAEEKAARDAAWATEQAMWDRLEREAAEACAEQDALDQFWAEEDAAWAEWLATRPRRRRRA